MHLNCAKYDLDSERRSCSTQFQPPGFPAPAPAGGALRRIPSPSGDPYVKNALLRTPFSAMALALGMLAAAPSFAADTKSVAVTAIVEHPALDAVRDG
eukprot:gene55771-74472_t